MTTDAFELIFECIVFIAVVTLLLVAGNACITLASTEQAYSVINREELQRNETTLTVGDTISLTDFVRYARTITGSLELHIGDAGFTVTSYDSLLSLYQTNTTVFRCVTITAYTPEQKLEGVLVSEKSP